MQTSLGDCWGCDLETTSWAYSPMCEEQSNLPRKDWRKKIRPHLQKSWSRVKIVTTSWSLYDDYEDLGIRIQSRVALFIEVRDTSNWQDGIPAQEACLNLHLINAASTGNVFSRARCIGYRDDDGEDLRPLIEWHHTTHDQDLYRDSGFGRSCCSSGEV